MKPHMILIALLSLGMNMNVSAQSETQHLVRRGESFALIAKRYGMTEEELKAANPNYPVCYMGLKLTIPEKYAKRIQSAAVTESTSGHSVVSDREDVAEAKPSTAKRKKKRGNFWKKLGDIASNVGDVAVSVASGMDEMGLLDKTGKTGEAIGGTADMVNMIRGKESNYLASAMGEDEYSTTENGYVADNAGSAAAVSRTSSSSPNGDLTGLQNRLAYVNSRLNEISQELANLSEKKTQTKYKQLGAASKAAANQRKYQNVHNNSVSQRKRWVKAGVQAQQPYVQQNQANNSRRDQLKQERSRLVAEKRSLIQQINALQGIETDHSSSSSSKGGGRLVTITCDHCNGLGKNPQSSETAVPENNIIYHCNICSSTRPHIHKTCPKCKGKGTIEVFR